MIYMKGKGVHLSDSTIQHSHGECPFMAGIDMFRNYTNIQDRLWFFFLENTAKTFRKICVVRLGLTNDDRKTRQVYRVKCQITTICKEKQFSIWERQNLTIRVWEYQKGNQNP